MKILASAREANPYNFGISGVLRSPYGSFKTAKARGMIIPPKLARVSLHLITFSFNMSNSPTFTYIKRLNLFQAEMHENLDKRKETHTVVSLFTVPSICIK